MFKVQTRLFGASLESTFPKAIPLAKLSVDRLGDELLEYFAPRGLVPEKIELTKRNTLFDYELKFSLFQGNAEFSLNARRLRLEFLNAIGMADKNTIADVIVKSHRCVQLPENTLHIAALHSHATFESPEEYSGFFSTKNTRLQEVCTSAGLIAYLTLPTWTEEFRLAIDRSLAIQNAAFVHGTTRVSTLHTNIDEALVQSVDFAFEAATNQCGLQFQPLA